MEQEPQVTEISREELRRRLRDLRLVLVDVLPRTSFEECHIPGAVNLPVDEIRSKARHALPNASQETVVYCRAPS